MVRLGDPGNSPRDVHHGKTGKESALLPHANGHVRAGARSLEEVQVDPLLSDLGSRRVRHCFEESLEGSLQLRMNWVSSALSFATIVGSLQRRGLLQLS